MPAATVLDLDRAEPDLLLFRRWAGGGDARCKRVRECGCAIRLVFFLTGKRSGLRYFRWKSEISGLLRTGRRKPWKVVELLVQVKNLFLELHNFTGTQVWQPQTALYNLKIALQKLLAKSIPPFPGNGEGFRRHFL